MNTFLIGFLVGIPSGVLVWELIKVGVRKIQSLGGTPPTV